MSESGYDVPQEITAVLLRQLREDRAIRVTIDITPEAPPTRERWPRLVRRWASKH